MYIVLEYMDGGSLADVLIATQLTGSGAPSELVLGRIAAKTLAGLNYLHRERHQVHRDIKPGNILLNSRGEIKISDFGLSAELDSTKEMCATFIGTHAYMSPERLGGKPYSFASDIWSLGITLIECAIGQFPYTAYNGNNYFVLLSQILRPSAQPPGRLLTRVPRPSAPVPNQGRGTAPLGRGPPQAPLHRHARREPEPS